MENELLSNTDITTNLGDASCAPKRVSNPAQHVITLRYIITCISMCDFLGFFFRFFYINSNHSNKNVLKRHNAGFSLTVH